MSACNAESSAGTTVVRETERKFDVPDAVSVPQPRTISDLDAGTGPELLTLVAVYFDTEDLRLLRAGVTLRRREGPDEGWHLRLPVGPDSRDEVRAPLGGGPAGLPPVSLVALTRVHTRGARLGPVAEVDTRRRQWALAGEDGMPRAEMVEDTVSARTRNEPTAEVSWREVEVELVASGDTPLLDRIERRLIAAGLRRSVAGSKLGRLMAERLSVDVAADHTGPAGSAGAVILSYLREQTTALRRDDPLVRRDVPDAVHRMRVAARRMRSVLQSCGRVLDRTQTRELVGELRWLATELGGARDAEVMEQRFVTMIGDLPADLVLDDVAATVSRRYGRIGAEARDLAVRALDSDRYLELQVMIDRLFAAPPLTRRADRPAGKELPATLTRGYDRLAKQMAKVMAQPAGEQRDQALHEMRKAAKRLRYVAEAVEPATGHSTARVLHELRSVQQLLGDHHDTVVSRPVLRELAIEARSHGENGFTYGVMYMTEANRADRAEQGLRLAWKQLRRSWVDTR